MPAHAHVYSFVMAWSIIMALLIAWKFVRLVNDVNNQLEWLDLISSRGIDGKQHADVTKIGQCVGVILAIWTPTVYAYSEKVDGVGLAAVLGAALGYLGAVGYGAAQLRVKREALMQPEEKP